MKLKEFLQQIEKLKEEHPDLEEKEIYIQVERFKEEIGDIEIKQNTFGDTYILLWYIPF